MAKVPPSTLGSREDGFLGGTCEVPKQLIALWGRRRVIDPSFRAIASTTQIPDQPKADQVYVIFELYGLQNSVSSIDLLIASLPLSYRLYTSSPLSLANFPAYQPSTLDLPGWPQQLTVLLRLLVALELLLKLQRQKGMDFSSWQHVVFLSLSNHHTVGCQKWRRGPSRAVRHWKLYGSWCTLMKRHQF